MIERIPGLPAGVLGLRASGQVSAADYETVLIPAVEEAFAQRAKVRLIYQIANDFTGFDWGAMWDDARVGLRHLAGWERVAVVTDVAWIRASMALFALAMPGMVRMFDGGDLDAAIAWTTG